MSFVLFLFIVKNNTVVSCTSTDHLRSCCAKEKSKTIMADVSGPNNRLQNYYLRVS